MKATGFEYRFRFVISAILYLLGVWPPWLLIPSLLDVPGFTGQSTWLVLSSLLARQGWLAFGAATVVLLVIALILTALGALLRIWGSAYLGFGTAHSPTLSSSGLLTDGPFRRTRNPLYLGMLLHTIGIVIIMPPSGAIFAVALLWIFEVRLALAEEPFLAERFGQSYLDYKAAVPRFLPSPTPQVAASGAQPHWLQAVLGELYFPAIFLVLAIFGWSFNAQPIRQGILISLGVWIIVRAFLPRAQDSPLLA